ncbi:N-acetylmuramoyl-L-alanine amidase [Blastococcus sp. TF02A_35]|uniref:N-acetylmuramoyl-L-alanine amidase n=1 Tax=Blastococcus sp. TF02A-35 TaxID=2559612 RepID=UPI0010730691|nr:N-acetylmuramoyl-L-alanine amidase [Blastococcus sp. TF02A_35]TFV53595.1 hypothetical protein E4P43_01530 [Blastococcus sp. TF02A_35]
MRRLLTGLAVFLVLAGVILFLPVFEAPRPAPVPVQTSAQQISMGSVTAPAQDAEVRDLGEAPDQAAPTSAPALTVTRTDAAGFSLVGVTWAHDPAITDTVVHVRVQNGDGDWGEWTTIEGEGLEQTGPGPAGEARGGTAPLWTGPSTGVQAELVTRSGARPEDVRLDLIDPGTSAADTALGEADIQETADAATEMPPVYSRAQWGADPALRSWAPEYAPTIKAATLHHTADTNNYTADQVPAMMRSIYRYHSVSLGWGDIGYNVIADKFGRLWEGRDGGLADTPIGAHAGGFNTGTFGVSMLGNYDTVNTTQPMVDAVAAIIGWKFSLYGVDPYGRTTLVSGGGGTSRYAKGVAVTVPTIFGHRDVGSTACPGQYGYSRLGEIRQKAAARIANAVTPEIAQRYASDPALRKVLGNKTGAERSAAGVVWQAYEGGSLFFTPATGVKLVRGGVLAGYMRAGGPASLGAPTVEEKALPDGRGVRAEFQRAFIYWSEPTGAHVVRGAIAGHWFAQGGESGSLGYPVADETAAGTGSVSRFERGAIYWSEATGAHVVRGGMLAAYEATGAAAGPLLFPTGEETDAPGGRGRIQQFQSGTTYWSETTGGHAVRGGVAGAWAALGGTEGVLGYPVSGEQSTTGGGGRVQHFQDGSVYWSSATGAHAVRAGVLAAWTAAGGATGPAGFPTSGETPAERGGVVQNFQSGSVFWSAGTGAHLVRGGIAGTWRAAGGVTGALGYPAGGEEDTPRYAGRVQRFEGGSVYWADGRPYVLQGDIAGAYAAAGGPGGLLGLPTGDAAATGPGGNGRVQNFQNGSVLWSAVTGAHVVRGGIGGAWGAAGGVTGSLGYPLGGEEDTPRYAGRVQRFQGGSVYWLDARPYVLPTDIAAAYAAAGGPAGVLGLPTGQVAPAGPGGTGRVQNFQSGSVYWSAASGAHVLRGGIAASWRAAGGLSGPLGYPTSGETATNGGALQQFQGGTVTWGAATGQTTVAYR